MLASLNHPHVGAIYGLDEVDGQQVLVLELVDGETLADRIARGPIPFDDAVVLATEIAGALEAAHEKGIIHRHLKPANIALTKEGAVKVLDFGLAKATDASGAAHLDMPTLTSPALMTGQGMILGTAAYMSPEQAKGRAADKRSYVWAFGCVVYEMLTGRRPFGGEEISDTLGAAPLSTEPSGRNIAISPDGSHVAYTTFSSPRYRLVVRSIDRVEGTVIAGTDGGRDPFFSADGRQIGYATLDELRRVSVDGGSSIKICRISVVFSGASWAPDDSIVFAQAGGLGLFRVPAAGGEPERIAAPDASKGERNYVRPMVLPDGRSVVYTVALGGGQTRIVARRLSGGDAMAVVGSGFGAEYLASGHLVYAQDQRLMAVAFDPATLRTTGSPVPVQEDLSTKVLAGVANVVAAGDGTVVFISGDLSRGPRHIVWVDRRGTQTRALEQPLEFPRYPRLSPDGGRLAITTGPTVEGNVWVDDLSASRMSQPRSASPPGTPARVLSDATRQSPHGLRLDRSRLLA